MPKRLKKLSEEVVLTNQWTTFMHDTYEKPNGEEGDYYYIRYKGNTIIIPVLEDGRVVLTLQHRYLADKQSIEFPGGGIDPHEEDIMESAKRELYEEAGCIATELVKIGVFEPVPGYAQDTSHLFIAHVTEVHNTAPDDTEEFEVLVRRPDEIDRMVMNNEIWHGQTLAAWAIARGHLLKMQPME